MPPGTRPLAIDLRSDTVTRPTAAMRAAMAEAEVGDDGWGDDPTVRRLEETVARIAGKEAGLFLPSGTMANQVALRLHARPGETIVAPKGAHLAAHEAGGAALAGCQVDGLGDRFHGYGPEDLRARLDAERVGLPRVGLVWLESTLGAGGGAVPDLEATAAVSAEARRRGRPVHLDGARLWHAADPPGGDVTPWTRLADTVSLCLSKGLGAPVGSVLCGPAEACRRARWIRQSLGGTMRQAGIVAAGGLYALAHHRERLGRDHRRAEALARSLAHLGIGRPRWPGTNMVLVELPEDGPDALAWADRLAAQGVLASCNLPRELRFVLHLGVDDEALAEAVTRIRRVTRG